MTRIGFARIVARRVKNANVMFVMFAVMTMMIASVVYANRVILELNTLAVTTCAVIVAIATIVRVVENRMNTSAKYVILE